MHPFYCYKIHLEGLVQGVGFRPFVYKIAHEMKLSGWVMNNPQGVIIQIESDEINLKLFIDRLKFEKPKHSEIRKIQIIKESEILKSDINLLANQTYSFLIKESLNETDFVADVMPDLATCEECLRDICDPHNRRYNYLFTNCTNCGPRFSIIQSLPYDRKNSTMASFIQCEECLSEYKDPLNRRFHAQPNACYKCGPQAYFLKPEDREKWPSAKLGLLQGMDALRETVLKLKNGGILAIKGIGGYHLAVDATNNESILKLRQRKKRRRKPLAVMFKSLEDIKEFCEVNEQEKELLESSKSPIVLLKKKKEFYQLNHKYKISENVSPNSSYLGVFLPYSPIHHLLLKKFARPLVLTSANLSDEPLVFEEPEVFDRLKDLADFYFIHNRPIARPIDDSVVQVVEGRTMILRMARGYAPLTLENENSVHSQLAVGPQMKNSFALSFNHKIVLSQHIGDLESDRSQELFESEVEHYRKFYRQDFKQIIHDSHPSYFTTEWAQEKINSSNNGMDDHELSIDSVQHHRAHVYSTVADTSIEGPYLGVSWDGTGYGDEGTIWGGEFFRAEHRMDLLERVGSLRSFKLIGGSAAVRSPWRVALALLLEIDSEIAYQWYSQYFSNSNSNSNSVVDNFNQLKSIWEKNINSPLSSSVGRFMEGLSALLEICYENDFEGDAAIQLQNSAEDVKIKNETNYIPKKSEIIWIKESQNFELWDWRPWVKELVQKSHKGISKSEIANQIHIVLIQVLLSMVVKQNLNQIVLGGGVFQNRRLLQILFQEAPKLNISVFIPQRVPINDGGIALGQIWFPNI